MEISKGYITMCKAAVEVQDAAPFHMTKIGGVNIAQSDPNGNFFINLNHSEYIWLPRQDQLQGLLEDNFSNRTPIALIQKFEKFTNGLINEDKVKYDMNQLWLCYLMFDRYRKAWDSSKNEWFKAVKHPLWD